MMIILMVHVDYVLLLLTDIGGCIGGWVCVCMDVWMYVPWMHACTSGLLGLLQSTLPLTWVPLSACAVLPNASSCHGEGEERRLERTLDDGRDGMTGDSVLVVALLDTIHHIAGRAIESKPRGLLP